MPIEVDSEILVLSEDEFHSLAHQVMGIAFRLHQDFGRLMNEEIYKQAIRRRCEEVGIVPARREVEIKVRYGDFEKSYFMDLLFALGLRINGRSEDGRVVEREASRASSLLPTPGRYAPRTPCQSEACQS